MVLPHQLQLFKSSGLVTTTPKRIILRLRTYWQLALRSCRCYVAGNQKARTWKIFKLQLTLMSYKTAQVFILAEMVSVSCFDVITDDGCDTFSVVRWSCFQPVSFVISWSCRVGRGSCSQRSMTEMTGCWPIPFASERRFGEFSCVEAWDLKDAGCSWESRIFGIIIGCLYFPSVLRRFLSLYSRHIKSLFPSLMFRQTSECCN
jgi:hypothetical protein